MILKNKNTKYKFQIPDSKRERSAFWNLKIIGICTAIIMIFNYSTCKYSFKDVSIPTEVKTFRVNYFENKARYVYTQLSPQLTEQLKQKILGSTRLRETTDDSAHYDISGYISDYSVSTTAISGNTSTTNRLSVTFHVILKNNLDQTKGFESDVVYTHDFPATQTLDEVGPSLGSDMETYIVNGIFNKIFSNW